MPTKNFKSPTGDVRRIALVEGGHIFLIGPQWQPLPEYAWPSAYSAGCISEDMGVNGVNVPVDLLRSLADENVLQEAIRFALQEALDNNITEAFKKNGEPNLGYLRTKLAAVHGANSVQSHIVEKVWFKLQNGAY
jgi:hypothetical protein